MKIALTCPASLPATQFGGILFLSIHIAKNLSEEGHEMTIYTSDLDFANNASTFNKELPTKEKIDKYTIKRTHVWFSTFLFFVNPGMYKQMLNDDFDIIHAIGVRSFQSFIATLVSKRKKIPLIIADQGGLTTHPDLRNSSLMKRILIKLQKPFIKFVINNATRVIVANEYEREIFLEFCNESKISTIRNGIDLDELNSSNTNFIEKYEVQENFILFLGRFHTVKGIDVLLDSISQIKNNDLMDNVKIVIMGVDFGYEQVMEKKINELKLNNKILLIKNPSRKDVLSAYNACKFLVLPSKWELSPLTPLEGFAFKKTVISTTAHGIPYTIQHNKNCILVKPNNPTELANAILDLIGDEEKAEELGLAGYDLVHSTCNSKNMVKETLAIYEKLVE
tara:strand:- start:20 stop:1201 length:1182 start_codon:yes stop_codon:yes gene_type:complete